MDRFNEKLLAQIPDGLAAFDGENRLVYWNEVLQKLTGLSPQEVLGQNLFSFFPGIKEKNQDFHIREALAGRGSHSFQFPFGEIVIPGRSFEIFYRPLYDDKGAAAGGVVLARDVSIQAQESRLIQEREERLRQFFEIAEEAIMIHDQGVIQDVNPALARMLGYAPSEMIGRHVSQFSDAVSAKKTKTFMAVGYPEGTYEYIAKRKDGGTFPIEIKGRDYEAAGKTLRVSTGWDISYRKKIEQTIQESEERLRRFVEITREGILVHRRGRVLDANPSIQELLGYSANELIGRDTTEFMEEGSVQKVRDMRAAGYRYPPGAYEVALRHKNGEIIPVEALGREIMWEGEPARFVSVWDIRDRKKAEDALRQSEEKFRSLIENSQDLTTLLDERGLILYDSPSVEKLMGFDLASRIGEHYLDKIHPDDHGRISALIEQMKARPGTTVASDFRVRHRDGRWRRMEGSATNLLDHPAVGCIVANYRDVTDRWEAAEALKQSELNFRSLIERAPEAIFVHEGLNILYANPRLVELLEYQSPEQILGSAPLTHIRPEDREKIRSRIERAQSGLQNPPMEIRVLCRQGGEKIVETVSVGVVFEGKPATMVMLRDLTEEKKAQDRLRQQDEFYRAILENTYDLITVVGEKGESLYLGPGIQRVLGYKPEERLGHSAFENIHPEDVEWARGEFQKMMRSPAESQVPFQLRMRHKDGSWRKVSGVAQNLLQNPQVQGVLVNYRDITAQAAAEDRFRRFAEVTQEGILVHDKGRVLDANQAFADMAGLPLSKIIGMNSLEFMDEESRGRIEGYIQEGYPASYEVRVKRKDGTTFPAEIRGRHFTWEGREVRVISVFDVTERQKTEEAMLKMERLSAIGEMAAGMAHEIRNPLSAISMAAQLLQRKASADGASEEGLYLKTILEQSARLEQLVKDTLDYARQEKGGEIPAISLKGALESALRLSQIQIGPSEQKVKVQWELSPADLKARAHPQRIQQILINLILNAYQAMPDGGTLTLSLLAEGPEVVLKAADTGPGLAKKDMQRLFEPFFTTKGTGSGLGLAISQRIAVQYGGKISADKLKPRGMAFTLRLPRVEGGLA
jgi:PAS domain S-box-containing protein